MSKYKVFRKKWTCKYGCKKVKECNGLCQPPSNAAPVKPSIIILNKDKIKH